MKAWYSFSESEDYAGDEPAFFDINHLPWKNKLEQNTEVFLSELMDVFEKSKERVIPYFNETLASSVDGWTIFPLQGWGKLYGNNHELCPKTFQLVNEIEGMTSCSFSILKAHSKIKPHHGDSNVMYRCHLTLQNFGELPEIGMRVKEEEAGWKKGEMFAFCDAHNHEVWNNTDHDRYVLIIDVLREPFLTQKKEICAKINATLFWQLKFQKFYFIKHLPRFIRRGMMNFVAFFILKKAKKSS